MIKTKCSECGETSTISISCRNGGCIGDMQVVDSVDKKPTKIKKSIQGELLKYLADRVEYYDKQSDSETGDKYDTALCNYYKIAYEKIKSLESE